MTGDETQFTTLDRSFRARVEIGNGVFLKILGTGIVAVETQAGTKYITNVYYVPKANQNLLSVGQLAENHYALLFKDTYCTIFDPRGAQILIIEMKNKCYSVDWKTTRHNALFGSVIDSELYNCMGHVNYDSLQRMFSQNIVDGLPKIVKPNHVYKICQLGKQSKLPFPKSKRWKATEKLQLIHTDLVGPTKTQSLGGSSYYLLFIDDATGYCWIFFLKFKLEAFKYFMKFKTSAENQANTTIKIFKSDNGKEFTSVEFEKFLSQLGINHQLTVPYCLQQNGVPETKNKTLMEMSRCLLFQKGLPKTFWEEVVSTTNYLLNLIQTKVLEGKTPFECWFGYKLSIAHLKVFGCIGYVKVPDEKRTKLDVKSLVAIHIGYSEQSKGYRMFSVDSNKIFVSRDIRLDERSSWNWDKSAVETSKVLTLDDDSIVVEDDQDVDIED